MEVSQNLLKGFLQNVVPLDRETNQIKKKLRLFLYICALFISGTSIYFYVYFACTQRDKDHSSLMEINFESRKINNISIIGITTTSIFPKYQTMKQREVKELNDINFAEEDMRDENGKPFHIVFWKPGDNPPSNTANPQRCHANISCEITLITEDYVNAHAIVIPAAMLILENNFPTSR